MQIPVGNFGYRVPQVAPTQTNVQNPGAVGNALEQVGRQGEILATQEIERQKQERAKIEAEAKRKEDEVNRSRAVKARIDYEDAVLFAQEDTVQQIRQGKIKRDEAKAHFSGQVTKARSSALERVSPELQDGTSIQFDSIASRAGRGIDRAIEDDRKNEILTNLEALRDSTLKKTNLPGADINKIMKHFSAEAIVLGKDAGLEDSKVTKLIQDVKDAGTYYHLQNQVHGAADSNKRLGELKKDITKGNYADLDPNKREALLVSIDGQMVRNQQKAEIAQRRQLANLESMWRRQAWYVEQGQIPPPEETKAFMDAAKGTQFAGEAKALLAQQKDVNEFMKLSPEKWGGKLNELATSYGPTPTKEQLTHLSRLQNFVQNSYKQLQQDPLGYAIQREGAKVEPLGLDNLETWGANLRQRAGIVREQSQRLGVEPKALLPQEQAQLAAFIQNATPSQRQQVISLLQSGLQDDKVYRATLGQIAKDSPVTALAGLKDRNTAMLLLDGESLLNPTKGDKAVDGKAKSFPMPKNDELLRNFNDETRDLFRGNSERWNIAYQGVMSYYAAKAKSAGDYSGEFNKKVFREAVKSVIGETYNYNGRGTIALPDGMTQSQFNRVIPGEFKSALEQAGRDPKEAAMLPSLGLQNYGDGYAVTSGSEFLLGKDGRPVVIRLMSNEPMRDASGMRLTDKIPK